MITKVWPNLHKFKCPKNSKFIDLWKFIIVKIFQNYKFFTIFSIFSILWYLI